MANLIYLKMTGEIQGLISAGCSSVDSIGNKAQPTHYDQIMVLGLTHGMTRVQNVNHQAVVMIKPLDKSSALLGKAISENESALLAPVHTACGMNAFSENQRG